MPDINSVIKEVNSMSLEKQTQEFEELKKTLRISSVLSVLIDADRNRNPFFLFTETYTLE